MSKGHMHTTVSYAVSMRAKSREQRAAFDHFNSTEISYFPHLLLKPNRTSLCFACSPVGAGRPNHTVVVSSCSVIPSSSVVSPCLPCAVNPQSFATIFKKRNFHRRTTTIFSTLLETFDVLARQDPRH